ncbi:glycosyltransferase [Roseobacter sp.]|uniref:glycosyltransferase n=1 Tax=Roseobacter sp. TaxID=1907202 RepID=UPI00385AE76B
MDKIKKLKRQRNWLLLGALPFLPFIAVFMLMERLRKRQVKKVTLTTFARFHGRDPEQIVRWLESFQDDLVRRLKDGGLHEMTLAAHKIEPLIPAYDQAIPIVVHPFTDRTFLKMINGILELQNNLDRNRFDTIIVTSNAADPSEIQTLIAKVEKQGGQALVIDTSRDGALSMQRETFHLFLVSPHAALLDDVDSERVLFEFIRSLQPKRVILADSALMWRVVASHGRALAAAAEISAFFSARPENTFTRRYFYRFFELFSQIHVMDATARESLAARFVLCSDNTSRLVPLDVMADAVSAELDLLPAIGGVDVTPCDCDAGIDISLIVTAHNETIVTGMSMIAANASVEAAKNAGFTVERIIALDAASENTRACLSHPAYADWRVVELTERDLGRARNRVVRMARGKYIAFLDADDLFSENWLAEGAAVLDVATSAGEKVIVHPEINWFFDDDQAILAVTPQDSPVFSPVLFYFENYYDSLCMAPRQVHFDLPYVSRDIPNGLSYQDCQFAIETVAAGWQHRTAPNTIIFKRRRDSSLATESRDRKSVIRQITPLSIDNIQALLSSKAKTPVGS